MTFLEILNLGWLCKTKSPVQYFRANAYTDGIKHSFINTQTIGLFIIL